MTKRELIDQIRRLNPTAQASFLASFDEEDLLAYLRQLREVDAERRRQQAAEPVLAG